LTPVSAVAAAKAAVISLYNGSRRTTQNTMCVYACYEYHALVHYCLTTHNMGGVCTYEQHATSV
jgi:hypothetical protein